ncbi:MAG: polyprenyl synthetase family protein [Pseudomonadota bacterium]
MYAATTASPVVTLEDIRALCAGDLDALDTLINSALSTDVPLVAEVSNYIVSAGGKRLRPLIVLLAARAIAGPDLGGTRHVAAAAIIEFIHTATLLHDDVVDGSEKRRGRATANAVFGNQASVLVGDFLYSRAFQMMVDIDDMAVMRVLADATNTIAAGEVLQLMNVGDPDTTEDAYRQVIYRKTARLFEAGGDIAAIITDAPADVRQGLATYGRELGVAFQLVDDALDYSASEQELGKNLGDDLAEGKPTLPIIHAIRESVGSERTLLVDAVREGSIERLSDICSAIESTGALEYTRVRAQEAADAAIRALSVLPASDYRDALEAIAEFSVARRF